MKIRIGVFFGGPSVEHEISVITALQAIAALPNDKYEIIPIYISKKGRWYTGENLVDVNNYKDIDKLLNSCERIILSNEYDDFKIIRYKKNFKNFKIIKNIDLAFPLLHGTFGEDGSIQGLFELMNIPYVGCNVLSSALGMDKIFMKFVLKEKKLPIVDYVWFYSKEWIKDYDPLILKIEKEIDYPVIVKPANLGSSIGITFVRDRDELYSAVELASKFSSKILVEKMITKLREINCSVLGDQENILISECEEPIRTGGLLTYEDKYLSKKTKTTQKVSHDGMNSLKRELPANLPDSDTQRIKLLAKETFKALGCTGVARIDFLIDTNTNEIFVNEINTLPGSLSFYLWEATNKSFPTLLNDLIQLAFKRHREKNSLTTHFDANIFNINSRSVKLAKS